MSKKDQRNGISVSMKSHRKSVLKSLREILFWWMRSPRTSSTKSSTSYCKRKIQIREDYIWMSTTRRSRIWSEEIQNTHLRAQTRAWISKTTIVGRYSLDRSTLKYSLTLVMELWIHLFCELEMKEHLHQESYARSCREIEELRIRCYQEKHWKTKKIGRISYAAWSIITYSMSILLWSWLTEQLWRTYISSSSSYYLEFKKAQPRSWNAAKYTGEYWYSWKRFSSSPCSARSRWIIQLFKKFGNTIGDSENKRNWEKWERRTIAINTPTLLFADSQRKSKWQKLSYVYD